MIAIIIIRAFTFEVFAFAGAPVMAAEEITALLETALVGSGLYTESELEGKSYFELNDLLKDGINSGQINPKTKYYTDPVSGLGYDLLDLFSEPEIQVGIGVSNAFINNVLNDAFGYWITDWANNDWYNYVYPTYNSPYIDIPSSGAVIEITDALDQHKIIYLNDYGLKVLTSDGRAGFKIRQNIVARIVVYDKYGKLVSDRTYDTPNNAQTTYTLNSSSIKSIQIYGDWRYDEDTPAETDDEAVPVIGEVAGTQVTPDMLNPDGTVTIDGTTYSPSDFIDWDKFKDNAIIDLLNDLLKSLENVPVIDESKTDIGEIDSDVALPSELSDFAIPGLIDVFPFCLPYDFIRGMRLFSAESEVPHFETEIKIPAFLNVPEQNWKIEIDFKEFEPLAKITRWCSLISFIYCLILLTPKIAKGA